MQKSDEFFLDTYTGISEEELEKLFFPLISGDRIYFFGDLGSGKSTFIRQLLRYYFHDSSLIVRSPTYTYYQKYGSNIFHFDLYRIKSREDLMLIGALDILEDPENICLIEWPEILSDTIYPTWKITISNSKNGQRDYTRERRII